MILNEVHWLTPEEMAAEKASAEMEAAELDARWPRSQRRWRCTCGAFIKPPPRPCKRCGERP